MSSQCSLAFKTLEKLPPRKKLVGGEVRLIEDLYTKNAYNLKNGKVARAVLLSLELGEPLSRRRGAGKAELWEGKIELEHLLPQVG